MYSKKFGAHFFYTVFMLKKKIEHFFFPKIFTYFKYIYTFRFHETRIFISTKCPVQTSEKKLKQRNFDPSTCFPGCQLHKKQQFKEIQNNIIWLFCLNVSVKQRSKKIFCVAKFNIKALPSSAFLFYLL